MNREPPYFEWPLDRWKLLVLLLLFLLLLCGALFWPDETYAMRRLQSDYFFFV